MRSLARARSSSRRAPPIGRVEPVLLDRVEQRRRLELVPRRSRSGLLDHAAVVDRLLHRGDDQRLAELGDAAVAVLDHLGEVVARVDVHHRERELAGPEGLLREAQEHDRVLAAGKEQHRALELGRELAHDVDRLRLELVEVGEVDRRRDHDGGVGSTEPPRERRCRLRRRRSGEHAGRTRSARSRPSGPRGRRRGASSGCRRSTRSRGRATGCRGARVPGCMPSSRRRSSRRAGSPSTARARRPSRASARSRGSATGRGGCR